MASGRPPLSPRIQFLQTLYLRSEARAINVQSIPLLMKKFTCFIHISGVVDHNIEGVRKSSPLLTAMVLYGLHTKGMSMRWKKDFLNHFSSLILAMRKGFQSVTKTHHGCIASPSGAPALHFRIWVQEIYWASVRKHFAQNHRVDAGFRWRFHYLTVPTSA